MKTFAEKENGRETKSKHIFILLASPEDSRKLHIGVKIILVANDRKNNSKQLKQKKRNLLVTDPGSWASVKVVSTCSNDTINILFSSLAIRNSSGLENSDNLYLHDGQRVISGFKYGSVFHKLHKKKKKDCLSPQFLSKMGGTHLLVLFSSAWFKHPPKKHYRDTLKHRITNWDMRTGNAKWVTNYNKKYWGIFYQKKLKSFSK